MPKLILAAVLLVLSINVFVLAGIAYNRSGDPVVTIVLTERELPIYESYSDPDENSGTSLNLKWQVFDPDDNDYNYSYYNSPLWLDHKKLTALGFDIKSLEKKTNDKYSRISNISNPAILVLEYDGETYRKALQAAEQKLVEIREETLQQHADKELSMTLNNNEKELKKFKVVSSRLYAIDAGLDLQALIKQYPDQEKFMFVRAEIGLRWDDEVIKGRIEQVHIDSVHVPLPTSKSLSSLDFGNGIYQYNAVIIPPRYRVTLNIGQRLEPWIESVKLCSLPNC